MSALDVARQVADAVLYEGYVLFPYRASALKNKYRWQWGVVVPQAQVELGASEPSALSCEVVLRAAPGATLQVTARFLHLRLRQLEDASGTPVDELEVDGQPIPTWEEGLEHEVAARVVLPDPRGGHTREERGGQPSHARADGHTREERGGQPSHATADGHAVERFTLAAGRETEPIGDVGRAVRTTRQVTGELRVDVEPAGDDVWRLRAAVTNDTAWSRRRASRDEVLRRSMVGVHVLLHTDDGAFASVIDPPDWADDIALRQRGLHPVLVSHTGDAEAHDTDRDGRTARVVLAAPIILYDHPQIAPESPGPSFDATEVDELLALAVMGLTDDEKRRARATDPRAAELVDRTDTLPAGVQKRLHGAVREWGHVDLGPEPAAQVSDEVRDLLGVGEEPLRRVRVGDTDVAVGDRVRLRPRRRADAHDLFVAGREALVERIVRTVEGETYLAVTVADDPAAELHRWYGRFQYFAADEVEPLASDRPCPPGPTPPPGAAAGRSTSEGG